MRLADIAARLGAQVQGNAKAEPIDVSRVTADSREVGAGDLFVATRGIRSDGHDFVDKAIAAGAAAVILERELPNLSVPFLIVDDGAAALGATAAVVAGDPATKMRLIGITGTNGKTTTSFLLEAISAAAGRRPGIIGTVSYRYGGKTIDAPYTTPTPAMLHDTFRDMHEQAVDDAIVEVSSVALSMQRLAGTHFDIAAFSNLSQDHLDVHGDMDAYRDAKALLFSSRLADDGVAVINIDDEAAPSMIEAAGERRLLRVTTREDAGDADVRVTRSSQTIEGIQATIATPRGEIDIECRALLGHYNLSNITLAVAIAEAANIDHSAIQRGVREMSGVPGRVERVANDRGLDILVDYAHTPDALANVLSALRPLSDKRLICVFGCGGDRDPSKRPLMGAAVANGADLAVITSDNPRTEDPHAIIDMILPAIPDPFYVEVEREIAIKAAIFEATPGDIVLIAGKGHEDYQILGSTKIHFDDREHAEVAAREREGMSLAEVATAVDGTVLGDREKTFQRVIIDGRIAAMGDLYVAIRGERLNGHDYVDQALEAGAVAALVEHGTVLGPEVSRVVVGDTRLALGALARERRRRWDRTIVGVTGSAGKTTTKSLIAAATRTLQSPCDSRFAQQRDGCPTHAAWPRVLPPSRDHRDGHAWTWADRLPVLDCRAQRWSGDQCRCRARWHRWQHGRDRPRKIRSLLAPSPRRYGRVPADDERLARYALAAPNRVSFGEADHADVRLAGYHSRGVEGSILEIAVAGEVHELPLRLFGRYNALNAVCAVAVALTVGVSIEDALAGLAAARPPGMRGELERVGGRHLFVDCYNSNPAALKAAAATTVELAQTTESRGFAVVGDMLELGENAADDHRRAGHEAAEMGLGVVAIGDFAAELSEGARGGGDSEASVASNPAEAAAQVLARSKPGDWILFKASRGAKLERVVEAVRELAEADERPV